MEYSARHITLIEISRLNRLFNTRSNHVKKLVRLEKDSDRHRPSRRRRKLLPTPNGELKEENPTDYAPFLPHYSKLVNVDVIHHPDRPPDTKDDLEDCCSRLEDQAETSTTYRLHAQLGVTLSEMFPHMLTVDTSAIAYR